MPALASVNDIYRVRTSTQDIVKRALRLIGALASGEPLPADQLDDGLEALNHMVDSWNTEKLTIYVLSRNSFALTVGLNPHEIGPGSAVIDAPRPNQIDQGQAWITGGNFLGEYELEILSKERWANYSLSTTTGIPAALWYETKFPLANIWLDVKPDTAYTLILYLEQMLSQVFMDGTTTELSLPPGYADALVHNLAIRLAPEYGKAATVEIINAAVESKAAIKRLNQRPLYLGVDSALLPYGGGGYDILRGDY